MTTPRHAPRTQRVGYVRVSTIVQNTDRQLDGVAVDRRFEDKASGKDVNRPALTKALEYVREGDTLVVHSMDRLARSLVDLERTVQALLEKGVSVEFVKESLRFEAGKDDPFATLMRHIIGAVAQFERSMIKERQREGIELAKKKGLYRGRKAVLTKEQARAVAQRKAEGANMSAVARELGVSRQTLYAHMRRVTEQPA